MFKKGDYVRVVVPLGRGHPSIYRNMVGVGDIVRVTQTLGTDHVHVAAPFGPSHPNYGGGWPTDRLAPSPSPLLTNERFFNGILAVICMAGLGYLVYRNGVETTMQQLQEFFATPLGKIVAGSLVMILSSLAGLGTIKAVKKGILDIADMFDQRRFVRFQREAAEYERDKARAADEKDGTEDIFLMGLNEMTKAITGAMAGVNTAASPAPSKIITSGVLPPVTVDCLVQWATDDTAYGSLNGHTPKQGERVRVVAINKTDNKLFQYFDPSKGLVMNGRVSEVMVVG